MNVKYQNINVRLRGLALTSFASIALLLAACAPAPTTYIKTGATSGEWPQDKAACLVEALKTVPADNKYSVTPGQEFTSSNCAHGQKDCNVYENYTPPQVQTSDANDGVRKAVFQACLAKRGWIEQTVAQ